MTSALALHPYGSELKWKKRDKIAQSVMCLATDAYLTAGPWVSSSILARSHTFVEIDHEIFSMVFPLPLMNQSRR